MVFLLVSMVASADGPLDDLISGKWVRRHYSTESNELIQEDILEINRDNTFRISVTIFGKPYGWYSGSWKLDNDLITWTREAAGPFPPSSSPVDIDRIDSVDSEKLVLRSARHNNPEPQIFERVE